MSKENTVTQTLQKLVSPIQHELPKRTPKWFKEYINLNTISRTVGISIIVALITGFGAFGGFPKPPKLLKDILSKIPGISWFALFLLIWQGGGGGANISLKAFLISAIATFLIWIIYKLPFVKSGLDDTNKSKKKITNLIENEVKIPKILKKIKVNKNTIQKIPIKPKQELVNIYNEKIISPIDIEEKHLKALKEYTDSLDFEMNKTIELKESNPKYDQQWKKLPKVSGNYRKYKFNSININVNSIENDDLVSNKPTNLYSQNTPYKEHNDFWPEEN